MKPSQVRDKVWILENIRFVNTFWGQEQLHSPSASIENMGQFVTLKNNQVQNVIYKKQGAKKQGDCFSKREEARLPFLFLNNNDPGFCKLVFATNILDPFLKVQDHKKISWPGKLNKWVPIDHSLERLTFEIGV